MKNAKRRRNGTHANHARSAESVGCHSGSRNGSSDQRPVLITGGAGFIGTNLAHRLLASGRAVLLYDNLSQPGVEHNLHWLRQTHGSGLSFEQGDVLDFKSLRKAVRRSSQVFHFAAQVAVTTSLTNPIEDFEINARGTINLLEALRACDSPPSLLFTSTNKVYGDLKDIRLQITNGRYEPQDPLVGQNGLSEQRPLAFHSPYGCSKGAACQYVLDYARTFGLRTVVFRMSCIYGLHQFGNEDQGWVAHFLINALKRLPITIFGDGRQVRDVLFVEDLIEGLLQAQQNVDALAGEVFNIGGGPANTISLLELLDLIEQLQGHRPEVRFQEWRSADQQYYVSDIRKFSHATGWTPRISVRAGVEKLYHWLLEFGPLLPARLTNWPRIAEHRNGTIKRLSPPALFSRIARSGNRLKLGNGAHARAAAKHGKKTANSG